jgi:predicted Zn-dependent peptidase
VVPGATITTDTSSAHLLSNGITVLLEPLPYLRTATAGVWIRTGSANEQAREAGVSHFLEHLFFKGTSKRSARQLMEAIESRGGHLNAFTSRDFTCLYAKMLGEHVDTAIAILGDILKDSQFFDFDKEKNVILEEIASMEDVPEDSAHDSLTRRFWPDHPLGMSVAGTAETVAAMSIEDVRRYFRAWYCPENLILAVAGSFDENEVLDLLRAQFEELPVAPSPPLNGPPRAACGVHHIERDIAQHHICFGFPGPSILDERKYVYNMLSSVLGGGSTSRLFDKVREQEGLAYSIYSFHASYWHTGMMGVYAAVAPESLAKTLDLSFAEVRRLREELVPDEEVALNREQLKGSVLMALESTFNRMTRMAKSYMYYGRVLSIDEVISGIEAVSGEDIRRLAQERFTPDQCAMVVLGPPTSRDAALESVPL